MSDLTVIRKTIIECDGKTFSSQKEVNDYITSKKLGTILDDFVNVNYKKNLTKADFKIILSDNLSALAGMFDSARPKRTRRSKAQMAKDNAKAKDKAKAKAKAKKKK